MRKLLSSTEVFRSEWMSVHTRHFDDSGRQVEYTVIERRDGVVIIPITETGKTLLIKNYRYPAETFFWEFPMGGIEKGEDKALTAERELAEETGLRASELQYLGEFAPMTGATAQTAFVYLAKISDEQLTSQISLQENEGIEDHMVVNLDQILPLIANGTLTDGFSLSAYLLYLAKNPR
jgi:ADP-ribose pyrophosphatase